MVRSGRSFSRVEEMISAEWWFEVLILTWSDSTGFWSSQEWRKTDRRDVTQATTISDQLRLTSSISNTYLHVSMISWQKSSSDVQTRLLCSRLELVDHGIFLKIMSWTENHSCCYIHPCLRLPLGGNPLKCLDEIWRQNSDTIIVGLPDGEEIMFLRFDTITGSWQTDRQTDGQTDTCLSQRPALLA